MENTRHVFDLAAIRRDSTLGELMQRHRMAPDCQCKPERKRSWKRMNEEGVVESTDFVDLYIHRDAPLPRPTVSDPDISPFRAFETH